MPAITLSTLEKNQPCLPRSRPSRIAESDGARVNALNAEIEMENAIVSANWRKRIPVVPGKNATGRNTATSTSEVAMTAPVTSFMAVEAALCASRSPSWMWRWMFSITTMASSTTSPVARVMPNRVRVLMENPSSLTKANVPTSETGIVTAGMMVLRQSSRKMKITRITITMTRMRVPSTSLMDSLTASVVSNARL